MGLPCVRAAFTGRGRFAGKVGASGSPRFGGAASGAELRERCEDNSMADAKRSDELQPDDRQMASSSR